MENLRSMRGEANQVIGCLRNICLDPSRPGRRLWKLESSVVFSYTSYSKKIVGQLFSFSFQPLTYFEGQSTSCSTGVSLDYSSRIGELFIYFRRRPILVPLSPLV